MIIGFLGKGGSGKSTLATLYTNHLVSKGESVLAIDADHNMDLSYNLSATEDFPYFGTLGTQFMLEHFGGGNKKYDIHVYSDLFRQDPLPVFTLGENADMFTKTFTKKLHPNLSLMSSGPHNDIILHGNRCSHSLGTPLKVYLPLLELKENEHVVVDMIASSDAAATGIPTGFSFAYVATEPTVHSIKAAGQIIETLKFFDVPFGIVLNKSQDIESDSTLIEEKLGQKPIAVLKQSLHPLNHTEYSEDIQKLVEHAKKHIQTHGDKRKERSILKIQRNKEFKEQNITRL
jgi:CO dehydrogenase maturation factor